MRSILLIIALTIIFLSGSAKAKSPGISINHYLETTGEIIIPIYVSNVTNVAAIDFSVYYNSDALEYVGVQNRYFPNIIVNNNPVWDAENTYSINAAWYTGGEVGQTVHGVFFEMIFTFNGGSSDFEFISVNFDDNSYNPIPINISNGSITYQEPVGVAIGEVYNPPPGRVDIPMFVDFSAVEAGVGAFDFLIEYDHNVLSEPDFSDEEVAGIVLTEPDPGQIRLQWENTSPPGSQLNGQLLNLNFQIIEDGESGLNFIEDSSSITNQDDINLPVHFVDGFVGVIDVYDVTFIVKDGLGGAVTNATIVLGTLENPPGNYLFTDVYAGTYSYSVTAPGFSETIGTVEVDQDLTITVYIDDIEAPQIECPADLMNMPADEGVCYAIIADIGEPTVSDNHTPVGELDVTNNAPENHLFPVGETIVTWTVTDAAGNTATCTQTITVVDNEPPQIACPPDLQEVATDEGVCFATITNIGAPDVSDNCTSTEDLIVINDAPKNHLYPVGETIVTWTVTDAAGNTATCTQIITVVDVEPPQIVCPPDLHEVATDDGTCYATIISIGKPDVSDNCTSSNDLIVSNDAPENHLYPAGETIVTWTVTDASGNTSTCRQTITVVDNEPPQITCPTDLMDVPAEPGQNYAIIEDIGTPHVSDNCTDVEDLVVTNNAPANDLYPLGKTIVTWTVTDAAGNTATCKQTIKVVDTESPVPPTETLEDVIVQDGEEVCFNATQTIITAGNDTHFIVEGGGNATLIAGESIRMLPGTVVEYGGYLHARITLDDEYCGAPVAMLLDEPAGKPLAEQLAPANPGKDALFKVYPNPTTGAFTLELIDVFADKPITVEIYGLRGERLFSQEVPHVQQHEFTLENQLPGIYIVRVSAGEHREHQRIIKR